MTPFPELEDQAVFPITLETKRPPRHPVRLIIAVVAAIFNLPLRTMYSKRRDPRAAKIRFAAYYLAHLHTEYSYPQIGRVFNKDHTTIMHGVKRCKELIEDNSKYAALIEEAEDSLNNFNQRGKFNVIN